MKKLLIIGGLPPLPPVNGGAVANLVQMFLEENEKKAVYEITVLSGYDDKIKEWKTELKHTDYKYVYGAKPLSKPLFYIFLFCIKIWGKRLVLTSDWTRKVVKAARELHKDFDCILVENDVATILPLYKAFPQTDIFLHLHNDYLNGKTIGGKRIAKAVKGIITVSDYIKSCVDTIPSARYKTRTVINSIHTERFGTEDTEREAASLRQKYGLRKEDIVVLFSGLVHKKKGVLELVQAFREVTISENELLSTKLKLVIVGNSWYGRQFKADKYVNRIIEECEAVKEKVIFTGYVDYEDMPYYYAMADIIVLPSVWDEPSGLTILEAMASGRALISTEKGGIPEITGEYAELLKVNEDFVNNMADKIKELALDKKKRDLSAKAAYEHVQKYHPERYYKDLSDLLGKGLQDTNR